MLFFLFSLGCLKSRGNEEGKKIMFWVFRTWGFSVCVVLKVGEGKRRQSFLLCCFGWWETGYFMFGCWDMEKKKKSKVSLKNCFFFLWEFLFNCRESWRKEANCLILVPMSNLDYLEREKYKIFWECGTLPPKTEILVFV